MTNLRVAVDVGGTFTDICILDEDGGEIQVGKVPATADPIEAVVSGVVDAGIDVRDIVLFSHGTTVATNALITRNLPPAAMVTTRHFRDVIEIRRGTKPALWDAYNDVAPPYIRRRDRFEVTERIDHAGEIVTPLDEDDARRVAAILRRRGVQTVAVCFINAHANPEHEVRMREILEEELPGVDVSTSAEILPEIFEHERFSTTVANAVLSPLISGYVSRLQERLSDRGYQGDLLLLHSGGGVMTPKLAQRFAVRLAASGIAAGAIASRHLSTLCGFPNAIGFDMGGTSTDVSLVYNGEERVTKEWYVEYGYPICFPSIEVITIGGAGPLHGAALAEELSIPTVLVPPSPGITSALGCLLVDVRHDLSAMFLAHLDSVEPKVLEEEFGKLETEARERLTAEGVPEEQMSIQRLVDMRYLGQWRSFTVPVSTRADLADAAERFHAEHERAYNYRRDASPVEIYRLSVRAVGVTPKPQLKRHELNGASPASARSRPVHFDASGAPVATP